METRTAVLTKSVLLSFTLMMSLLSGAGSASTSAGQGRHTVKYGPGHQYADLGWVEKGESLHIRDVEGDYYQVSYTVNGTNAFKTGYLLHSQVENIISPEWYNINNPKHFLWETDYIVGSYTVYSYPDRNFAVKVGSVSNEDVTILEDGPNYQYIDYAVTGSQLRKRGYIFR